MSYTGISVVDIVFHVLVLYNRTVHSAEIPRSPTRSIFDILKM